MGSSTCGVWFHIRVDVSKQPTSYMEAPRFVHRAFKACLEVLNISNDFNWVACVLEFFLKFEPKKEENRSSRGNVLF